MQHPFQLIASLQFAAESSRESFALAANGSKLLLASTKDGLLLSTWSAVDTDVATAGNDVDQEAPEPPNKKQKTSNTANTGSTIIKLTIAPEAPTVVVVTEDKQLHVLSVSEHGQLTQLSRRSMPKRSCAVRILPDNKTIILGDKFGDVYSLPLYPDAAEDAKYASNAAQEQQQLQAKKDWKPSASDRTVHTQRNLKALEAQQNQKSFTPRKEPLAFEHKLLLGHVSMLTDVVFVKPEDKPQSHGRIITADRDEHIRVSRPPPQAHIIEGFCLGHEEFISKLCPISKSSLLVSGGGDDWLGVWDWETFVLHHKLPIGEAIRRSKSNQMIDKDDKISVSGLWNVPLNAGDRKGALLVACERVPALCAFSCDDILRQDARAAKAIPFDSIPLDVTVIGDWILITFDAREPGQDRIRAYTAHRQADGTVSLEPSTEVQAILQHLDDLESTATDAAKVDGLLYNVGNLRKRGGSDEQVEEGA